MKIENILLTRFILFFVFVLIGVSYSWAETYYTVKRGDSLYTIAKKFKITVSQLKEVNHLTENKIKEGQQLLIPSSTASNQGQAEKKKKTSGREDDLRNWHIPETHTVKKGETLRQIARRYRLTIEDLKEINQLPDDGLKVGQVLYLQKINGREEEGGEEKIRGFLKNEEDKKEIKRVAGLGFLVTEKDRELLIRVAKSFLGLRYARGGASINGLDCSAFVQKIFNIFGIELPRTAREQFQVGYAVSRQSLRQGDLVFFRRGNSPQPAHVGIYIGNNQFIHTSLSKGRVEIDDLQNKYFSVRFIGARRVEENMERLREDALVYVHPGNPWE